jgi:protein SCO1
MYRTVFLIISFIISVSLVVSCSAKKQEPALPYYNTPAFAPQFFSSPKEAAVKITHTIPPFSFTNQHGQLVTQKDIESKIHVANFFFTACGSICPSMMNNMKTVRQAFKADDEVVLLSYSVTPWIDSVPRLRNYAAAMQITGANWHLLTGQKGVVYELARKGYFAEEDLGFTKDSTEFLHTEHFLLVDRHQRIRGIYNGTLQLETQQLINDIQTLKAEE